MGGSGKLRRLRLPLPPGNTKYSIVIGMIYEVLPATVSYCQRLSEGADQKSQMPPMQPPE
jgi:hypothetical protein